jgi:peptidylprolyl isomerase
MSENKYIGLIALILIVAGYAVYAKSNPKDHGKPEPINTQIINISSPEDLAAAVTAGTSTKTETSTQGAAANTEKPKTTNSNTNKKIMNAVLHTNKGDITIEFKAEGVPNTVANFTKLAGQGFYNGVKFHRVIKGFMIQGGDPNTKNDSDTSAWGMGGPGYKFNDELTPGNKNDIGTISMANSGPNTNGSQFFINTAANNFLDGKHVVFGKVTAGLDVIAAIENTPVNGADRPIAPVVIEGITLK